MPNIVQDAYYFFHFQRLMAMPLGKAGIPGYDVLLQIVAVISQDIFSWLNNFSPQSAKL